MMKPKKKSREPVDYSGQKLHDLFAELRKLDVEPVVTDASRKLALKRPGSSLQFDVASLKDGVVLCVRSRISYATEERQRMIPANLKEAAALLVLRLQAHERAHKEHKDHQTKEAIRDALMDRIRAGAPGVEVYEDYRNPDMIKIRLSVKHVTPELIAALKTASES